MRVKNIIFDLGGILINLDFNRTTEAFDALGFKEMDQLFGLGKAVSFIEDYEVGGLDDQSFINAIRNHTNIDAPDQSIIDAWNALLLDFESEKIELLKELSKKHRLFLFSNTNSLHLQYFAKLFKDEFGMELNDLFEKAYYSHEINQRKPYKEAFEWVLKDAGIDAADTLFVDDALNNIEGATSAGIHTLHVPKGKSILTIDWSQYQ